MAVQSSPVPRSHSPANPFPPSRSVSPSSISSSPRLTVERLLNLLNETTEFVPFTVDHDSFEQSSLELLKLVFPDWFLSPDAEKQLKLAQCTDGITNKRKLISRAHTLCFISFCFSHEV